MIRSFPNAFARPGKILMVFALLAMPGFAQSFASLPDAPQSQTSVSQEPSTGTQDTTTGTISGTVLDAQGAEVQNADVKLSKPGSAGTLRDVKSGTSGMFVFSGLEPGTYTVTVSGRGMSSFVSKPIQLLPGQSVDMPGVVLSVAGTSTSITVMDQRGASIEQMHVAEQQRVLRIFPNFYSSFDRDAPPLMNKQKYHLALRSLIDPVSFLGVGAIAGAEQYQNVFPSFGGGFEGYAKRYGAAYADRASSEFFTRALLPSIFHNDPRYFVMGTGTTRDRALHAVSSTFMTRGDDGGKKINYSTILGKLMAASLSEAYFPEQERGVHLVLINGLGDIGGDAVDNLIREFVLNRLTTRAANKHR